MKKEYVYISLAAAIGVAIGFAGGILLSKKKANVVKEESTTESKEEIPEEVEPEDNSVPVNYQKRIDYSDRIRDLEYKSEENDISDEEMGELENYHDNAAAEEYRKENFGKIEVITRKEWEKHLYQEFSDVEYDPADLYYFPDTDWLTDEFGGILEPTEKYIGNAFDKYNFRTNTDEEIYVRNHPMETDFAIHKIVGQTRDEYFE